MKRILITLFAVWLSTSITVPDYAQEIRIGMPLSKLLPILADQKCHVDTTREGRIKSYITQLIAKPYKRFGIDGRALFIFDPEPDTLRMWEWKADSMAHTDYHLIVDEISRELKDTGVELLPPGYDYQAHMWNSNSNLLATYYRDSDLVEIIEGSRNTATSVAPATPPPPPPPDTASALISEGTNNFSYEVENEDLNPNYVWGRVTVKLSKKITKEQLASVAKRIREEKWESNNLMIFFRLPGMNDSTYAWATASFDANKKDVTVDGSDTVFETHLDLLFLGSSIDGQRRAVDTARRQKIDGKVIGLWWEEQFTHSVHIIFETQGKIFVRQIIAGGGGLSEDSDVPVLMSDIEIKKSEVKGETRLLEPEDSHGEYFVINKDGNLEIYDEEGYMTAGERIQR